MSWLTLGSRMTSLEKICLDLIAEEFEKYHFAFVTSNNEDLKRNIQFLQGKYSSKLASKLYKRDFLKDEYLQFLLNKHMKYLNMRWLNHDIHQNSMRDILCRVPNLKKISCVCFRDECLEYIAKFCPKIVEIDATVTSITDDGLKYLCESANGNIPCPDLKKLSINNTKVTICGLKYLIQNLKSLEVLDHVKVPLALQSLHKENLHELENASRYNLVQLDLLYLDELGALPYYNDLVKICLTVCPKLKSLSCCISDGKQLDLFNNTCLQELYVSFKNPRSEPKISIDNFLKNCGAKLSSLSVSYCIMSVSSLSVNCPKLKNLSLMYVTFTDDYDDSKSLFNCLDCLSFSSIEMSRENDKAMSSLLLSSPNLKNVRFRDCNLSPDMKTCTLKCCENCSLKVIDSYEI